MAQLSRLLRAYLRREDLYGQGPLKVVVGMERPAQTPFAQAPRTPKQLEAARDALAATGIKGPILRSPTLRPLRMVAGVHTVTLQVNADQVRQLADVPGVRYIRPVRMHRMHLDRSVALLGIDAQVRSQYDGKGIRVAVIDSGIDHTHPDLRGRVNL